MRAEVCHKGAVRIEEGMSVTLRRDAHLMVVAVGEGTKARK